MKKAQTRWWDLPSIAFMLLAILFSTWRLQLTEWAEGPAHVRPVAVTGLVIGLLRGQSSFKKRGAFLLAISDTALGHKLRLSLCGKRNKCLLHPNAPWICTMRF